MAMIFYNDKFYNETDPIVSADNRGLKYGDGLFETLKYKNGHPILLKEHLKRLWEGMKLLHFEPTKLFTPDYIEKQIRLLILKNNLSNARVKITLFRGNGGLYDPENHRPNLLIQTWPLPTTNGDLNQNGLQVCLYKGAIKTIDSFSQLKHNNFLPYVMGALHAKKSKNNDAILLNQHGNICDSTIANVFIIKNNQIFTPPLSEGCIAGIMRAFIIDTLQKNNFQVFENPISESELLKADEIFLTNSIYYIRWIESIDHVHFSNSFTQKIYLTLSKTNPTVFC